MVEKKRTLRDAVRDASAKPKVQPPVSVLVGPTILVPKVELVEALCKHVVEFELGPEKYRLERRKKITEKACKDCRLKAQAEREAKERAEGAERRKNQSAKDKRQIGRLPDQSVFGPHKFNAASLTWTGTLTIPLSASEVVVFTASASGILGLHSKLDKMYRASRPKE